MILDDAGTGYVIGLLLFCLCLILYVIGSLWLLRLMVRKMIQFTTFANSATTIMTEITSTSSPNNHENRNINFTVINSTPNSHTTSPGTVTPSAFKENINLSRKQHKYGAKMSKLSKRLIVLYSTGLVSSIIVILFILVFSVIFIQFHGDFETNVIGFLVSRYLRLLLMIDANINCICLLFQNETAHLLYEKHCCLCHTCVKQCVCYKIVNHQFTS